MSKILSQTLFRLNPGRGHTYLVASRLCLSLFGLLLSFVYLFYHNLLKFLWMLLTIPLTAWPKCCANLRNQNCEPQEALIARIEIISCKSANFALKMIRQLIIRLSCLVVHALDWGSNECQALYQRLAGDVPSLFDKGEMLRSALSFKCPPYFFFRSSPAALSFFIHFSKGKPKADRGWEPSCHSSLSLPSACSPQMSNQPNFSLF